MSSKNTGSQWISLSDMMTGLMLVFLLISVLVISEIQKEQESKNRILLEYNNTQDDIYKDLKRAFEEKEKEWEMTIDDDLSIKFTNPDVLFDANSAALTLGFGSILDQFIPTYLSIINNKKYEKSIVEVRIEGHAGKCEESEYMICLNLSQSRANSVLLYVFNNSEYRNISLLDQNKLKFWFTSNGMSNGKNLDYNGDYTFISGKDLDPKISRRVEFKIVTNSEVLVNELLKNINN